MRSTIGATVRARRVALGMTQEALARHAGLRPVDVPLMEGDLFVPADPATLARVANALALPIELLRGPSMPDETMGPLDAGAAWPAMIEPTDAQIITS